MAASAIEDMLDTLSVTAGVIGVVICDADGTPIRDNFRDLDRSQAIKCAAVAAEVMRDAVRVGDLEGGLTSLRVRTTTIELFIKTNGKHIIVVMQDPRLDM